MVAFAAHQSPQTLSVMAILFLLALLSCIHDGGGIGTSQAAVTDPGEVNAVNSIFTRWKISAKMSSLEWNTSNNICSDVALEGGSVVNIYNDDSFNPGIICDCRFEGGSVCHITRLKASNLNITGRLPMELMKLTYLNNFCQHWHTWSMEALLACGKITRQGVVPRWNRESSHQLLEGSQDAEVVDLIFKLVRLISKNYFTGPLPTFIGNFSEMLYISIGFNSFSGEIPKELGNLKKLKSLDLGLNNFTGRLPPELGNMAGLEQMYVDNSGVNGSIPLSFANFTKLKFMFAGDNKFGQKLPGFIGNLSSIQKLRLRGNSFQGPVPSSFSNLVNLEELWLSELLDESSSLLFIENMTRLSTLILRNSNISGVIPSSIEKNTNLAYLDLSFNNLSGQIPQSLFNLPSLKSLYLGNNSFTGALPTQKSDQLHTIDLSYNDLSGSLPSWSAEDNLQLNLVANNFNSNSDLPPGLDCIQKNTPCFRDSPIYSSFAINCGGNEIVLPDGTVYEADNKNLSTASYFVNKDLRWAVSSIGSYLGAPNSQYTHSSSSNFRKTSNQELFQSSRSSPSSLRYYGLALENGNYNVTLKFAETAFPDAQSWLSLGKRIFDIYVQGLLVEKDFDIRRKAGERSFTAISRSYTASVSSNFLEIHLFWAGKGSWSIPTDGYHGPLVSAISVTPNFKPTVSNHLPKKKNKALLPGLVAGIGAAVLLLPILAILIWRWQSRPISEDVEEDLQGLPVEPNCFDYAELQIATDSFNPANKLGEGGFGSVFKGTLPDGRQVAIKQLSANTLQGKKQFATEVATISAVQHQNLVKLYGCCYEGKNRLLVYEYLENKSLDHALSGKSGLHLDWSSRFDICLGTARGLAYLHEESRIRIVHRDIKAGNILLDANCKPKISDFGLAKLYDDQMTHISTRIAGTFGYLAPEYAMRGYLTEKADVFGFGIVVLEILSGIPNAGWNSDGRKVYLLEWAWQLHEENRGLEMLDPSLSSFNETEAIRMIQIAFLCTQMNPTSRPAMSRVVAMLVGNAEVDNVSAKPVYLTEWKEDARTTTEHLLATSTFASTPSDSFMERR